MQSIMISIKPKYVAQILNGEKTIEIRKTMPKCLYPIDVYIYCTKGKPLIYCSDKNWHWHIKETKNFQYDMRFNYYAGFNGKVVAKFTLNKVEELYIKHCVGWNTNTIKDVLTIEEKTCVSRFALFDYLGSKGGYAWHISNLEIFDRPKELSEFDRCILTEDLSHDNITHIHQRFKITKAPQSWCYVEVKNDEIH